MFIELPENLSVYATGDRAPWCEGCYGVVVAKIGGFLAIRTDDKVDRLASEKQTLNVEQNLQRKGVRWH